MIFSRIQKQKQLKQVQNKKPGQKTKLPLNCKAKLTKRIIIFTTQTEYQANGGQNIVM